VGGGAVADAAAEMLRREGYSGRLTMLTADKSVPCDRHLEGLRAGFEFEQVLPRKSESTRRCQAPRADFNQSWGTPSGRPRRPKIIPEQAR
jgi:hypothetical protein